MKNAAKSEGEGRVELRRVYADRAADLHRRARACRQRYNRLALLRLALFVAGLLLLVYFTALNVWLALLAGLFAVGGFYRLIRNHQAIQERGRRYGLLARINAREAALQDGPPDAWDPDWPFSGDGSSFVQPEHPYSTDLDLFGPHSFFAYANRCNTSLGRAALAAMWQHPADPPTIEARQEAAAELAPALEWRQQLEALGHQAADDPAHLKLLEQWLADEPWVINHRGLRLAMVFNPLLVLTGLVAVALGWISWTLFLLFLLPALIILRRTLDRVNRTHRRTTHAEKALSQYGKLVHHVESASWTSDRLRSLQENLRRHHRPASEGMKQLGYLIAQLNVRFNFFAIFLNLFALWDLYWIGRLERWRERYRAALPQWFEALAEIEALSSLATLSFNHPDWVRPQLTEALVLEGAGLGHPLIPRERRIPNDLAMPATGHLKLITGSNMAGKSTFLRTVGLNIVLAMSGSTVCARTLRLPVLQVFTSMRTQDALHESTSSFYAELKRLHQIIEAVEHRPPGEPRVFYLLDEILKGTNSVDRHTGSRALLRQLIRSKAAGLVATHDLELGAMEAKYPGAIENLCMEVRIEDGELHFDYKLRPGVSHSFNATLLMRKMGIDIPEEEVDPAHRLPGVSGDSAGT